MNTVELFEHLAFSTWERIKWGKIFNISQGEETITDNNLLEIAKSKSYEVKVIKTPRNKESEQGTDWEGWIGNYSLGWLRYAVQAKKNQPKS